MRKVGIVDPRNGQGRDRTADTVIFSHVLYQLSYLASGGGNIGRPPGKAKDFRPSFLPRPVVRISVDSA